MIAKNLTKKQLYHILRVVNRTYENNIMFKSIYDHGRNINFALQVVDSRKSGAGQAPFRVRKDGGHYRTISACWHVHGHFFDIALTLYPNARILSKGIGCRRPYNETVRPPMIDMHVVDGKILHNWTEFWRGSNYNGFIPQSGLCECEGIPSIPDDLKYPKMIGKIIWLET